MTPALQNLVQKNPPIEEQLIKIENLRYKLNSTSIEDRQRLLLLSQKLDKLILTYQRQMV
ncbi:hypothetical protein Psch_03548 [Pelotomaculum schinkii]|uniref:Spo0E like sporulation regulatory protein n=1 Tax=Pelotomaculum schinkii TaxID=78350 RepID=A0A4Y7R7P0_9FIRM|nr:Spo0E family sporulation regulatory protein-aspartic acid phosphatase [Pelotomaculum schinkii]TEB04786.1 hypothetical protein Psch_03548 [Pelotomaculum schinkii]